MTKPQTTLLLGDCRDSMRAMAADSIDAIVSDPPYGLSNNGGDSLGKIYTEVVFPYLAEFYSKRFCNGNLPFPSDSVSLLDFVNRSIRVEARIGVPEGSIDFDCQVPIWEKEVKATGESPIDPSDAVLSREVRAGGLHVLPNFVLQPRPCSDSALGDCLRGCYRESDLGCVSVTVVVPFDSDFARFLGTLSPSGPSFFSDLVRAQNDPQRKTGGSSNVVAGRGAEFVAVLRLDVRSNTVEILPADSALLQKPLCEVILPSFVGTNAGTGSLPPKFEPVGFSVVGDTTNRAVCFNFHTDILSYLRKDRNGFMGKGWDHGVPGEEFWKEALRVAKPGAYLLAFGGTRTFHRLTVAIEDAGWEIRDCIMWVYGSGFPKSHDVSKAIDRAAGAERTVVGIRKRAGGPSGMTAANGWNDGPMSADDSTVEVTEPATEEAKRWEGWGTALKPAWEPVIVARKPVSGTVAENVLKYGVGGLNIDGCRVATADTVKIHSRSSEAADSSTIFIDKRPLETHQTEGQKLGRWPANLIHDGSGDVVGLFPNVKCGVSTAGHAPTTENAYGKYASRSLTSHGDSGSAARFFYCSKADNKDRNEGCENLPPRRHSDRPSDDLPGGDNPRNRTNNERSNFHPCVKPTDLMRYLCRLVTPPGGLILDPFMGSGSTGKAAVLEGFNFVGCELDPDYLEIARARIAFAGGEEPEAVDVPDVPQEEPRQLSLFGGKQ